MEITSTTIYLITRLDGIDDFCHMGDDGGRGICEIEREARRLARRFRGRA